MLETDHSVSILQQEAIEVEEYRSSGLDTTALSGELSGEADWGRKRCTVGGRSGTYFRHLTTPF